MDKTYFENMKAQIKEFRQKMKDEGKDFFLGLSKELFENHPKLLKFGWKQFTPYYNDGDPCVFSSYHTDPSILVDSDAKDEDGKLESWCDEDEWLYNEAWFPQEDQSDGAKIYRDVEKTLSQFDDDDMENFFGDHVQVVVSRDGVEVEDYEHD